jgi:hypothetical protein
MTDEEGDQRIVRIVELARHYAAEKHTATAALCYEAAFTASQELKTPVQRLACGEACAWKAESARLEGMLGTAADWYWRAVIADPLAEELRALYLDAVRRSRDDMDKHVRKLEEVTK